MSNIYAERYTDILGGYDNIHPNAKIGKNVRMGRGVIIEENCVIGDNAFLGHYVILRHNVHVGEGAKLMNFCTCEEGVRVGNYASIGVYGHLTKDVVVEDKVFAAGYLCTMNTNRIAWQRDFDPEFEPPIIRYGARIGARVSILPGKVVERECLIAAESCITKNCQPFGIYMGTPARLVGEVPQDERL